VNVAIVCPYSMALPGGVQEHVRGLAAGLVSHGCEVVLFAPDLHMTGHPPGVTAISLGGSVKIPANGSVAPIGLDPRMLVRLELALDPAEVIHVHEPFLPAGLAAVMRAPRRTAVIGTFHAAADRSLPYAVARPLLRRVARRMHATTAVSPAARALVTRYVPTDPVIVPNGVDATAFATASPDPWASTLGRVVLFVGRPEPRKGFDVAVRAFCAAAASRPDIHLVCLPAREVPAGLVPPSLADRVHTLGPVPADRKLALFRSATALLVPSRGSESFGIVVLEGMAAGCAVLASDIPGYRAAGGEAVRYVSPGDVRAWVSALGEVLDSDEGNLAAAGTERARTFDWPRVAARTLDVYRGVLPVE